MAFDHPLEADRVDDLNFFTTIIRAPVVGALFWFLGGEEAKQRNEEEKRLFRAAQLFDETGTSSVHSSSPARSRGRDSGDEEDDRSASSSASSSERPPHSAGAPFHSREPDPLTCSSKCGLLRGKAPPGMAESDVSFATGSHLDDDGDDGVVGECGASLDRMSLGEDAAEPAGGGAAAVASSSSSLKRKKELSWSDNLVEYVGEPTRHETNVRITDTMMTAEHQLRHHHHHHHHRQQTPGGMSRSRSVRANMVTDDAARQPQGLRQSSEEPPSRYLPRGLDKAHNGIILPRMPYGAAQHVEPSSSNDGGGGGANGAGAGGAGGGGGVESPQWGWFLRTTPPTPQMYYPRASTTLQRHGAAAALPPGGATTYDPAGPPPPPPPSLPPPPASLLGGTTTNPALETTTTLSASPRPNPIFQGLQNKHHAAPMGWSSVPL